MSEIKRKLIHVKSDGNLVVGLYFVLITACEVLTLSGLIMQPEQGYINLLTISGALFAIPSVYLAIRLFLEYNNDYSNLFAIIGYPLLLSYCLFLLPSNVPDENAHIRRMFDLFPNGDYAFAPKQINDALDSQRFTLYSIMYKYISEPAAYDIWTPSERWAGYSWFLYLMPYLIGRTGILLSINPWVSVFFARFFNMIVYFAAGYWILKRVPIGRAFFFVFMLNPLMLQQQASCSADSLTNTSMLLFVSQVLIMRFQKDSSLSFFQWSRLFLFLILIALCKLSNLPLGILCFILLPKIKHPRIKKAIVCGIPLFALAAILFVFSAGYGSTLQQVAVSFRDPIAFILTFVVTLTNATPILLMQYFGGQLGWPELNEVPGEFYINGAWITTALLMVVSLFSFHETLPASQYGDQKGIRNNPDIQLRQWEIIICLFTGLVLFFVSYLALSHGLYYFETSLGYISWMQGRHFLPAGLIIGLGILLFFYSKHTTSTKVSISSKAAMRLISQPYFYAAASGLTSLYTIIVVALDIAF